MSRSIFHPPRNCPRLLALLACAVFLGAASPGAAQPATDGSESVVARVAALYKGLYFDEAKMLCEQSLAGGGHPHADTLALLRWKGILAGIKGDGAGARDAFQRLLAIDASAELGSGYAPRIAQAFAEAQAWAAEQPALSATVEAPEEVSRHRTLRLGLLVDSDPLAIAQRAALYLRAAGAPDYEGLLLTTPPFSWRVQLGNLAQIAAAPNLEYHIALLDAASNEIHLLGTATAPLAIRLTDDPPLDLVGATGPKTPWYKTWWFWTAASVAVVGAGVTTGIILAQPKSVDGSIVISAN